MTHRFLNGTIPNLKIVKSSQKIREDLATKLKSEKGWDINCDGGAEVVNELLKNDLIDELTISVVPILVGNGTRLFKEGRPEQLLEFISAKTFETGLTQLYYKHKTKY